MSKGYIYCVSTPANNDRCKVGETLAGIEHRLKGLNNTSVSENFKLDFYIIVDPNKRFNIEKLIHNDIINEGYSRFSGKEFFKCQPNDIKHIFKKYGDIYTTINNHKNINILSSKSGKIHKCEKCKKEFIKKSAYDSHSIRINPCVKDNINYDCSYCNKNYSNKYNLSVHLNICKNKKLVDDQLQIEDIKKLFEQQQKQNQEQNQELNKKVEELSNTIKILLSSGNIKI